MPTDFLCIIIIIIIVIFNFIIITIIIIIIIIILSCRYHHSDSHADHVTISINEAETYRGVFILYNTHLLVRFSKSPKICPRILCIIIIVVVDIVIIVIIIIFIISVIFIIIINTIIIVINNVINPCGFLWYIYPYSSYNYKGWVRISIRWIHERYPIPRFNGRAIGCLLWMFVRKFTAL